MPINSRIVASLAPLASLTLLLACRPDSDEIVYGLQAERFANSEWSAPVNLGPPINTAANEMNAALSPDELSLYFVSTRAGGFGGADIWVSRRTSLDGPWGEPQNLGANVNAGSIRFPGPGSAELRAEVATTIHPAVSFACRVNGPR